MTNFAINPRNCVSKTRNLVSKMMNFADEMLCLNTTAASSKPLGSGAYKEDIFAFMQYSVRVQDAATELGASAISGVDGAATELGASAISGVAAADEAIAAERQVSD